MSIEIDKSATGSLRAYYDAGTGIVNGDEKIFKLDPAMSTTIEGVVTSAGSATLKYSLNETEPTDFTNFTSDSYGAVSANMVWTLPAGVKWVGLDVASGTWNVFVRQSWVAA